MPWFMKTRHYCVVLFDLRQDLRGKVDLLEIEDELILSPRYKKGFQVLHAL